MADSGFSPEELDLIRQWYDVVRDVTPEYLEGPDHVLALRVHQLLDAPASLDLVRDAAVSAPIGQTPIRLRRGS